MLPLEGVRVLDLSHALAGAACSNVLGRYGAEVIKVERPEVGDDLRHFGAPEGLEGMSLSFCSANAGKKSLVLDLKNPASRPVFERLAKTSHILVENFRPGVTKALGVDWESVRKINPAIVYCSVTGFGQTGPLRDRTAYDHIVQATAGVMEANGLGEGPRRLGLPAIDTFSGYFATVGVLAALRRAEKTGEGEFIDVGMIDAAMTLQAAAVANSLYTGKEPARSRNTAFRVTPTAGVYETADGHIDIGANHQHQVLRMFEALGIGHLQDDERFATHQARLQNGQALYEELVPVFKARTGDELEDLLSAVQVPAAAVRTVTGFSRHAHFAARELVVDAGVPARGKALKVMRGAPKLAGMPAAGGDVPDIGQHTEAVLRDLGFSDADIAGLKSANAV